MFALVMPICKQCGQPSADRHRESEREMGTPRKTSEILLSSRERAQEGSKKAVSVPSGLCGLTFGPHTTHVAAMMPRRIFSLH